MAIIPKDEDASKTTNTPSNLHGYVNFPEAVKRCSNEGKTLQSLEDAIIYRDECDKDGSLDRNEPLAVCSQHAQITSTVVLYSYRDGVVKGEVLDLRKSLPTSMPYLVERLGSDQTIHKNEPIIELGAYNKRIFYLPSNIEVPICLDTSLVNGMSELASNPYALALLGDCTERFAAYARRKMVNMTYPDYKIRLYLCRDTDLESIKDTDNLLLRPVLLGHGNPRIVCPMTIDATFNLYDKACARGIDK